MWHELETNKDKWGCEYFQKHFKAIQVLIQPLTVLGRTDELVSQIPGKGNKIVYVSYWRSLEDLHRFNLSPFHMEIRRWWNGNLKNMPHLGIFHETYSVEPHQWETIYENFHPMGLGMYASGSCRTKTNEVSRANESSCLTLKRKYDSRQRFSACARDNDAFTNESHQGKRLFTT